jgi:hypothetical protein
LVILFVEVAGYPFGTYGMHDVSSDHRTLGIWPDFLQAAWDQFKPMYQTSFFATLKTELTQLAAEGIRKWPYPVLVSREVLLAEGVSSEDIDYAADILNKFHKLVRL